MPATAFDIAVAFTLAHEGGYSNDPDDPGGETIFGISKVYHPAANIKTPEAARAVYRSYYWQGMGLGRPAIYPALGIVLFESAVLPGPRPAGKFLQWTLNALGGDPLKVDGWIGAKTINKLRALTAFSPALKPLIAQGVIWRRARYFRMVTYDAPVKMKYLRGWLARCEDLAALLIKRQISVS